MSYHARRAPTAVARGSHGQRSRTVSPRITVHLPPDLVGELNEIAILRHEPVSGLVREAIVIWLAAVGRANPFSAAATPSAVNPFMGGG